MREKVIDRINELFIATDERAWERVRACFTPLVTFDMSSLSGQPAQQLPAGTIVSAWEQGLAPIEHVHHQAGNHRVDLNTDDATAFCYAVAYHYKTTKSGRNVRMFVGSYDFHLVRSGDDWLIDLFKFNLKFIDGNPQLESDQ